jgi:hypothetical protein
MRACGEVAKKSLSVKHLKDKCAVELENVNKQMAMFIRRFNVHQSEKEWFLREWGGIMQHTTSSIDIDEVD